VKRFYADDSAATSVKVGYCQASYKRKTPEQRCIGVFFRLEIYTFRAELGGLRLTAYPPYASFHVPGHN
jgi:hypothetical protein